MQELETLRGQIRNPAPQVNDTPAQPKRQTIAFKLKYEYQAQEYRQFLQKKLEEVRALHDTDLVVVEKED